MLLPHDQRDCWGSKAERFGPKLYLTLPAWCWEYIQDPLSGIYIWSFIGYKEEVGSDETELEPPKWKINHIYFSKELYASEEEVFANHQVHGSIVKRTTRSGRSKHNLKETDDVMSSFGPDFSIYAIWTDIVLISYRSHVSVVYFCTTIYPEY